MNGLFWLALGGAFGTLCRYGLSGWVQRGSGGTFPWGTLAVNVLGCLVMGLLYRTFEARLFPPEYRTAILIGVLGGFTTFSSFGIETFRMLNDGQFGAAVLYVGASNAGCLAAVWLGYRVVERVLG